MPLSPLMFPLCESKTLPFSSLSLSHFTQDGGRVQLLSHFPLRLQKALHDPFMDLSQPFLFQQHLHLTPLVHKAHLQGGFLPVLHLGGKSRVPSPLGSLNVQSHPLLDLTYGCKQGTYFLLPASNSLACFPLSLSPSQLGMSLFHIHTREREGRGKKMESNSV